MKWIDYREKLGIGFNSEHKFKMLSNILQNFVNQVLEDKYDEASYLKYCQMIGEVYRTYYRPFQHLTESFANCNSMIELISKFIAFYNTYETTVCGWSYQNLSKSDVLEHFKNALSSLKISYEIYRDDDGVFVFPCGAKELDNALVSEPLEWLNKYPQAHKTYCIALKQYSEGVYIRDVADNLRKSLEAFLQEFLQNTKNLESNKNEICKYLGDNGVDPGVAGLFQPLINAYKNINDRIAKHNDAVDAKLLEFLLYQTGILIRMVLMVNQ